MSQELRQAPLRRSIYRHATVLGAERTPMMLVILIAMTLTFVSMTLLSFVLGMLIFGIGVAGLRAAAKLHPQATRVYLEFLRYRRCYPARARLTLPMPYRLICENAQGWPE